MVNYYTISTLVENHAGVLSRVAGLFARRGFNIESLAVGVTEDPTVSRITIVVAGDEPTVEQMEKQLNKLVDVIRLKTFPTEELIRRELLMVKISCTAGERGDVLSLCKIIGGKICDLSADTCTIEISAESEKLEEYLDLLRPYGIRELVRTGTIALQKGAPSITLTEKK